MKIDENSKYLQINLAYLLNDLGNFNEVFRKDVTYDLKNRISPSLLKIDFLKNHSGDQIDYPPQPF